MTVQPASSVQPGAPKPGPRAIAAEETQEKLRSTVRLLLWKMSVAEKEERESIRKTLQEKISIPPDILLDHLVSPSPFIRTEALKLLAPSIRPAHAERVLPLLQDYSVDVRAQAKRLLSELAKRASLEPDHSKEGVRTGNVTNLFRILEQVLKVSDALTAPAIVDALLDLGARAIGEFWSFYERTDDSIREKFSRFFLVRGEDKVRVLLLRGLSVAGPTARDKIRVFIQRSLTREAFRTDMDLIMGMDPSTRSETIRGMHNADVLIEYMEKLHWIAVAHRPTLIEEIAKLGSDRYRNVLARAMETEDYQVIRTSLAAAIETKTGGLESLASQLIDVEDPEVQVDAAIYLGDHGTVEHVARLIPLMSREDPRLARAGVRSVYRLLRNHLLEHFDGLAPAARQTLAMILKKLDVRFAKSLAEDFSKVSSGEKMQLIRILDMLGEVDTEVQAELRKMSDDPDERVRATAARTLGQLSDWSERYVVGLKLLSDADSRVRANAVEALDVDSPEIRQRLRELALDGEARERANAIRALRRLGEVGTDALFEALVSDPRPDHRISAGYTLGEMEFPGGITILKRYLEDPDPGVRVHAVRSMGKRAPDSDIRNLTHWLEDEDAEVRRETRKVIRERLNLHYDGY